MVPRHEARAEGGRIAVTAVPLVRAVALAPFLSFAGEAGVPVASLLDRAGLSTRVLDAPELPVPFHLGSELVEHAARAVGIDDFGAQAARRTSLAQLGTYGVEICRAPTLSEAIRRAAAMRARFNSGEDVWLEREPSRAWVRIRIDRRVERARSEIESFTLLMLAQLIRMAAGPAWRPWAVEAGTISAGARSSLEELGAPVRTGRPGMGIAFDPALLVEPLASAAPFAGPDPVVPPGPALERDFVGSVRRTIETFLQSSYPEARLTAQASGMSLRTFQRRLATAGTSYGELVEEVRCELAMGFLRDRASSVTEIAFQLGYSDPANFSHAFRRWTGVSPSAYRRL